MLLNGQLNSSTNFSRNDWLFRFMVVRAEDLQIHQSGLILMLHQKFLKAIGSNLEAAGI